MLLAECLMFALLRRGCEPSNRSSPPRLPGPGTAYHCLCAAPPTPRLAVSLKWLGSGEAQELQPRNELEKAHLRDDDVSRRHDR
jgi:hypothetical protein